MQQIATVGMVLVIALEAGDDPGGEQHVRIATEHCLTAGLREDPILRCRGADDVRGAHVASLHPRTDHLAGVVTAVVIDDQELRIRQILVQPQRLQGEVHAVKIVVGGHPDC